MSYEMRRDLDKTAASYRTAFACHSDSVTLHEIRLVDPKADPKVGQWGFGREIRRFTLRHYNLMTPKSLERIIKRYHRTGSAY